MRLSAHSRRVLYLHGHIHDHPIEVVEQQYPGHGRLLSISAPLLSDGFNLISIEFGHAGRPMGASVIHHRYEKGGDVRARPEIRIGLGSRADEPSTFLADILAVIDAGSSMRFRDLERALTDRSGEPPNRDELCDALWEAEWSGHLVISDREDEPSQWTISRDAL